MDQPIRLPNKGPDEIYADGGLIGPLNPSPLGGTWAWCWVAGGRIVRRASGVIWPDPNVLLLSKKASLKGVSNNISELVAAVRAIESLPDGWVGPLWTDSHVTACRLRGSDKFTMVPRWLIDRTVAARRTFGGRVCTLAGHPTEDDLLRGRAKRNGLPVSPYNVWCDDACHRRAEGVLRCRG